MGNPNERYCETCHNCAVFTWSQEELDALASATAKIDAAEQASVGEPGGESVVVAAPIFTRAERAALIRADEEPNGEGECRLDYQKVKVATHWCPWHQDFGVANAP